MCFTGGISSVSAAIIVNPALTITELVTIQPIVVSDNNGSNTAEFFGTSSQQSTIEGLVDNIWGQAGIDIDFLSPTSWNNSFANSGSVDPRPTSDLSAIVSDGNSAGVTHTNPNVINMFFVNIPAGFSVLSENFAAGLAYIGYNGITQYVGSNLLMSTSGLEAIASVVAHEIGHNLGLDHSSAAGNLMFTGNSTDKRELLTNDQISIALASNFSVSTSPVPLPPAFLLFLYGIGFLGFYRRKRTQPNAATSVCA